MSFASYFRMRGMHTLAVMIGGFVGSAVALLGELTGMYRGWIWGLLIGAGVILFLSVVFPLMLWASDAPYRRIVKAVGKPTVYEHPVRFAIQGGEMNGYVALMKDTMILLSVEHGNPRLDLKRDDIQMIRLSEDRNALDLFLSATKLIHISSTEAEEIFEVLQREGWN